MKKRGRRETHTWVSDGPTRASFLAGKYRAQSVGPGARTIRVLSFDDHVAGAKKWGEAAERALGWMQARFGGPKRMSYGVAEMRVLNRSKSYNYEADGFSVFDRVLFDGREPDARKIGHEVAHAWWGGFVDASGRGERFLTESLAEASALLYVEQTGGEAAGIEARRDRDAYYRADPGEEPSLADATFRSPRYARVVYGKGGLALIVLRDWIGEEPFDRGLRAYATRFGGTTQTPDVSGFLSVLREEGGDAVDHWSEDWLERAGAPSYRVEIDGSGRDATGRLVQDGDIYRNPIELDLGDGRATRRIVVTPAGADAPFEIPSGFTVRSVEIDPRYRVPGAHASFDL